MMGGDSTAPFVELGERIKKQLHDAYEGFYQAISNENNWFTKASVQAALAGIARFLSEEKLAQWLAAYKPIEVNPQNVGIVMAGNIPMAGFHDLLCVLLSGHRARVKPSAQDSLLMDFIIGELAAIEADFKERITKVERLNDADAFIAAGSDNSARYFRYYFGKKPHIIRQHRTSAAVLGGGESPEQLNALGRDIFTYYGLGCRSVSKVFVPEGYDFNILLDALMDYESVGEHHKYRNNYDYNKSLYLVNKEAHLDTGFLLARESTDLVSPIAVLFYETYKGRSELSARLSTLEAKIQCKVGQGFIPFGQAQQPELWDYADGVDTMDFLLKL